ncbi:MAG: hypothetical protein J2P53_15305, partial [Bradyrhizobiaceae bacterium]|nr:hypothetical protein [Bradyrhizobiaceae bacterium]
MTRKSLLLCTVMAFAAGSQQIALSQPLSPTGAVDGAVRLAQADEKDKHPGQHPGTPPPGQHPPAVNAPGGRPGGATTQPAPPQQHPATQNAPAMQPHPGAPGMPQQGMQHRDAPGTPPAAQNAPAMQHPGAPGTPQQG